MGTAWVAALFLALVAATPARGQVRQADVPRQGGLDLATASRVARGVADVTFDGDSVRAGRGIAPLPGSEAAFEPLVTTSLTALPLQTGAGYLVNDRAGHTWVLHVIAADGSRISVSVAPAAATLRRRTPAASRPGTRPPP